MRSFVITIESIPESVEAANRCIQSAAKFGYVVEKFSAITPENDPIGLCEELGIDLAGFSESKKYSRLERCVSAFLSHRSLWVKCAESKEEFQIFEHDAVFVDNVPEFLNYKGCVSLGAPSYGRFNTPPSLGVNPLTSKPYFPGAHAYRLKSNAAAELVEYSFKHAEPTDIYLRLENFSWLEEYYPWPVVAKENFSTIQHEGGCSAKHAYNENYKLL